MFCKNCGKEVNEGAVVCLNCGVLVGMGNKFCQHCGFEPDPLAVICVKCGRGLKDVDYKLVSNGARPKLAVSETSNSMSSFLDKLRDSVRICFRKFATFSGRATKSEFWYFVLFSQIVLLIPYLFLIITLSCYVASIQYYWNGEYYGYYDDWGWGLAFYIGLAITGVISLGLTLPSLSALVRRLHDIGKSGWNYFVAFIPPVGAILLLLDLCKDGDSGENKYGPSPKGLDS